MNGRPATACAAVALAAMFGAACSRPPASTRLLVAAAADLTFAMDEISGDFHRLHPGLDLRVSYGSSGNFYAQIRGGAPFDIFLSADTDYPRRLERDGVGVPGSVFVYAVGRIVVWAPAGSPLDPASALTDPRLSRLAIANPQHAPYGRAAEAAIRSLGAEKALRGKLVLAESVAQAFSFASSGAADAAIVALSLAGSPRVRGNGRYWPIPSGDYPRLEQAGIVLRRSPAAAQFAQYLQEPEAHTILHRFGFAEPGEE